MPEDVWERLRRVHRELMGTPDPGEADEGEHPDVMRALFNSIDTNLDTIDRTLGIASDRPTLTLIRGGAVQPHEAA
jgi:hypothetical protein